MKLLEILSELSEDDIKVQYLLNCMVESKDKTNRKTKKVEHTRISFLTKEIQTGDLMFGGTRARSYGVILWLPKDKIDAIVAKDKADVPISAVVQKKSDVADWSLMARTLKDAQKALESGGARYTWLDAPIDIAADRATAAKHV